MIHGNAALYTGSLNPHRTVDRCARRAPAHALLRRLLRLFCADDRCVVSRPHSNAYDVTAFVLPAFYVVQFTSVAIDQLAWRALTGFTYPYAVWLPHHVFVLPR